MSHVVTVKSQIKDPVALAAACRRLGLAEPVHGTATLYSGQATGLIVQLPQWRYPVVIDPATAEIRFDNFNNAWGQQSELDRLLQAYAVAKCQIEARKAGSSITEQALPDGSIKLIVQAGGGAS